MKGRIDWEEATLARWMNTITKKGTRTQYRTAFRRYHEFTGMPAPELIDEAIEDARRDPREKTDVVKRRLIEFYDWLVNEAPHRKGDGKGYASKTGHAQVNAIRSLYGTFDVFVKLKGRSALPAPRVENRRMILDNVEVKRLAGHTRNLRDRAIVLTLFQSGMDVSTLCGLKYGDVSGKLGDHPLKLELHRTKSGTDYYTFLGRDAVEAIRAYVNDVKAKGLEPARNTPLFVKLSWKAKGGEGIEPYHVQNMMRSLAQRAGFVDEDMNGKDMNPLSPHALRESFGSVMTGKGVPDTVVDFWLGHEIGEMAEAYKRAKYEDVEGTYLEKEPFISVSTGGKLEEKLRAEIDEKNRQLQTLVNGLATENMELKQRFNQLKQEFGEHKELVKELKKAIQGIMG